jgi:hypothetical protein
VSVVDVCRPERLHVLALLTEERQGVYSLLAEVTLGSGHRNERDRVRLRERLSPEIIGTKDPSHKGPCCVCSSDLVSAKSSGCQT